jgi:glycine hydroxymethyltransferase
LTHGSPVNFSGRFFDIVSYGVSPSDYRIDFDQVRDLAISERPRMIVAGHSAYPRELDFKIFREIADESGALLMADIAHIAGLVVAGIHPSPFPWCDYVTTTTHKTLRGPRGGIIMCRSEYAKAINSSIFPGSQGGPLMHVIAAKAVAFKEALEPGFADYQRSVVSNAGTLASALLGHGLELISGGTDNHLLLVDLRQGELSGRDAQQALDNALIITNRNMVPFDQRSPFVTSGLRLGTPAVTSRGMGSREMESVAEFIAGVLKDVADQETLAATARKVMDLCRRFPIYPARGYATGA